MRFLALVFPIALLCSPPVLAQQASGHSLYQTYCESCHGAQAKGDGTFASMLRRPPADLTKITEEAGGTFPTEQVYQTIDGREPVPGHGGGDMPVWGDAFSRSSTGASPEEVKAKIDALVQYIQSLQPKSD